MSATAATTGISLFIAMVVTWLTATVFIVWQMAMTGNLYAMAFIGGLVAIPIVIIWNIASGRSPIQ